MRKLTVLSLLIFLIYSSSSAQKAQVHGRVSDTTEKRSLRWATVTLLKKSDSTLVAYTRTDNSGKFLFPAIDTGKYVLLISYPRFGDYLDELVVNGNKEVGDIALTPASKLLDAVIIRTAGAIRIKGDTTEFVADSFKVKDGGTVEDLLKKLPGLTVNSKGEIQAQGKRVDKVLVDGEEFFGDDPTMATQNISAKAVDRVQVFDTRSEQQKLTGMTTGTEGKTVNIKLKEDAKKGAFGKIYGGTDFNKFFDSKIYYNNFKGKKKASVYGTRTNVGTGSLNWDDRQKLGIENDFEYDELSGYYFSFGGGDEFNDWNLRGLPDAWTGGALFSNKWGNADKNNLNISYRYNRLSTINRGTTYTQNILPTGVTYSNKYSTKNGLNEQHAINGKYEWKLDSLASFKLVVANTVKNSHTTGSNDGEFLNANLDTVNQSFNRYDNKTQRNQLDNQFTYKQLFRKKNRLWMTVLRYGVTDDENSGFNFTRIRYFNNGMYDHTDTIDQVKLFDGRSTTMGIKTSFTEPFSAKWMLVLEYAWNKNHSKSFRNTYEKNNVGKYEELVPEFSNNFILDAYSNSGSAIFRFTDKKLRAGIGSGVSAIRLGLTDVDNSSHNTYHFFNITPQANLNLTPRPQFNIGINYRGNTIQPTISQLQPLRDNTDPLNEFKGNPDLKVGFTHSINLNLNEYKVLSQSWKGLNFSYNIQQNAITQFNTIDLATGKRTFYPVNINGNRSWYLWSNYNKSKGNGKPNYGFGFNGNGSRFKNYVNGELATTRSVSIGLNLNLGIEKEDVYDFSISPRISYNHSRSSLSTSINNNYFSYGGWAEAEFTLPGKFEINNSLNVDLRQKIQAFSTNTNLVVWNGSISKKIFKKDAGKISFYANDILNQNKGFSRTINSTFISDDRYLRISRYFLLKFEWSFNKSPGGNTK
jgi:hypothetical protein